ncbi:response regulator [Gracilinema caldarium]|uniref:Response regulator receiver protein n=1 Tax=Gracilinema caldarium (strain ATCC 51460 / DSM 7334 / H1) TaxID=744872 RepID=F8EYQ7_GRAC1|nr:response regulator [Gracilinema caldarium]AEJ18634.1 response regulator receiver protein [Gracilinema caldarium DSM 7334]
MAKNDRKIRIFSALEVANICGVVNQTAINWIRNGYLKAFTTPGGQYRVYAEDLKSFLDERGMRIPDELSALMQDEVEWKSVLIVDDDKDLNDLMKKYLEKKLGDYIVYQAFDGFEAGKALADYRPGFIFLDIDLPGIDGHKLCRKIKEDPTFGKPFVIAMTGLDIPEEKRAILDEGADAFFGKPLDFDQVLTTIHELSIKLTAGIHE